MIKTIVVLGIVILLIAFSILNLVRSHVRANKMKKTGPRCSENCSCCSGSCNFSRK